MAATSTVAAEKLLLKAGHWIFLAAVCELQIPPNVRRSSRHGTSTARKTFLSAPDKSVTTTTSPS
ncbi:hypothetical protein, partial [Staphylococcus aureus]